MVLLCGIIWFLSLVHDYEPKLGKPLRPKFSRNYFGLFGEEVSERSRRKNVSYVETLHTPQSKRYLENLQRAWYERSICSIHLCNCHQRRLMECIDYLSSNVSIEGQCPKFSLHLGQCFTILLPNAFLSDGSEWL